MEISQKTRAHFKNKKTKKRQNWVAPHLPHPKTNSTQCIPIKANNNNSNLGTPPIQKYFHQRL